MLSAIDVGNTLTKVYNLDRGGTVTLETPTIIDVENALKVIKPGTAKDIVLIGASVVPKVQKLIDQACDEARVRKPTWIHATMPLGVQIDYKTPETLGADRIANVLGAFELCEPPFIVVDMGTATKLEVVDHERRYIGGSILPSAQMGLRSLRFDTAQLPTVQMNDHPPMIGVDTQSAMLTGAVLGHRFAVEGFITHYSSLLIGDIFEIERIGADEWLKNRADSHKARNVNVVITGGNAKLLEKSIRPQKHLKVIFEPRLTAIGLEAAARRLGIV